MRRIDLTNEPGQFGSRTPRTRTVAGDLSIGLSILVTIAFLLLGSLNLFYSYNRDRENLNLKATELAVSATEVLASPVWNIDEREIQRLVGIYLQYDIVIGMRLTDERGQVMIERRKSFEDAHLTLTRPVERNGSVIGQLTIWYTDAAIRAKQWETVGFLALVLAAAIAAVTLGTRRLMARFLKEPLEKLISGLDVIAAGDYRFKLPAVAQEEVNRINSSVNSMARELSIRETALEDNRQRLELLNLAIMDIFSGHDTASLIDQALKSTARLAGASLAAFTPAAQTSATSEPGEQPQPRLLTAGQILDLKPAEAIAETTMRMAEIEDSNKYRFALKSRHRHVGDFTLGFERPLDPPTHALVKSITSLATVAMIRQSFIRESAFLTAELKVAESVQRATLPAERVDSNMQGSWAEMDYHYEPVLRVGGDWIHVLESPAERAIYALMGDVTGHGIAQSMITTAVSGALETLQNLMLATDDPPVSTPSQILGLISSVLSKVSGESNLQMTCAVVKIDFRNRRVTVANAGHQYPILLLPSQAGPVAPKAITGGLSPILGMAPENPDSPLVSVMDAVMDFPAGATLLLFTDGLVDGRSRSGNTFHRAFFHKLGTIPSGSRPKMIKDAIITEFKRHTTQGSVKDDVCLLVIGGGSATDILG
jgi:serine phosphatase RsbU (regulator of sigma subunit)/HAMP domain-containing protein